MAIENKQWGTYCCVIDTWRNRFSISSLPLSLKYIFSVYLSQNLSHSLNCESLSSVEMSFELSFPYPWHDSVLSFLLLSFLWMNGLVTTTLPFVSVSHCMYFIHLVLVKMMHSFPLYSSYYCLSIAVCSICHRRDRLWETRGKERRRSHLISSLPSVHSLVSVSYVEWSRLRMCLQLQKTCRIFSCWKRLYRLQSFVFPSSRNSQLSRLVSSNHCSFSPFNSRGKSVARTLSSQFPSVSLCLWNSSLTRSFKISPHTHSLFNSLEFFKLSRDSFDRRRKLSWARENSSRRQSWGRESSPMTRENIYFNWLTLTDWQDILSPSAHLIS